MTRLEELTLRMLDGELDDEGAAELETLVEQDEQARRTFVRLLEQEGALRGLAEGEDVADATVQTIRARMAGVEQGVMAELRGRGPTSAAAHAAETAAASPWVGTRYVLLAAAVLLLALGLPGAGVLQSRLGSVAEQELLVLGQWNATPGIRTAYRVLVRNGKTGAGMDGADVEIRMVDEQGEVAWRGEATTGDDGVAPVEIELPPDAGEGQYSLEVSAKAQGKSLQTARAIKVERSFRLFLSTDKPRYQPGQLVHMRALALGVMKGEPAAERDILFEVHDGKGNKVFKKSTRTSEYGIAAVDFQLADHVNMGEFAVRATLGDTQSERTVTVERYRLPKFRVEVSTERGHYRPGETVTGEVTAQYTFGEPVADAEVRLVGSTLVEQLRPFETLTGRTDAEGRWAFELPLGDHFVGTPLEQGDAVVMLEATVTDGAGHEQTARVKRNVSKEPIRVDLVPESGELVPGVDNTVYVVTSYPDGRPAPARVEISPGQMTLRTDEAGFGQLTLPASRIRSQLDVSVRDDEGRHVQLTRSLPIDASADGAVLLRTDRAVYRAGQSLELDVLTAGRAKRVFVDVVKDRQTVLSDTLELDGGRASHVLDLPADLTGTLAISAYHLPAGSDIVRDTRLVQVAPAEDLEVRARLDRETYRPGETAVLDLEVRRGEQPVAAAVSLWGVDEAVFALQEMRPGLEKVYFALREELLEPRYEIHAASLPSPGELLEPTEAGSGPGADVRLAAAVGGGEPERHAGEGFAERMREHERAEREAMETLLGALALSPALLFVLLLLPLLALAAVRLWRRAPVTAELEPGEERALRRRFAALGWLWALGLYVPPLLAALGAEATGWRHRDEVATLAGIFGAWVLLMAMAWPVYSIRRAAPARAFPTLRRVLLLVPLAYAALALAVAGFVLAGEERWLDEEVIGVVAIATIVLACVVTGALGVAGRTALRPLPGWRRGLMALGRPIATALPATLLLVLTTGAMQTKAVDGGVVREEELAAPVSEPEAARVTATLEAKDKSDSPGEGGLKAPSRIRRHFPETLLWKPQVVTDADGEARVEIPLADSITTWRIGAGAVSRGGLLGSETVGIRVFQDFFVDLDLPVALTQNDEVEVPVAIYNYLDEPQTVRLDLDLADWYEARGGRSRTVMLEPGEITNVTFPIVAKRPGEHALTVRASGTEMADAVQRNVRVEPDGEPVVQTSNGRLKASVTEEVTFPADAVPGANELLLKIYPGSFSQVMEGLDGILRMPSGCFEQTSSATYPNVLVLDYLQRTDQAKPEVQMKATEYIETGYQRLLSFEVDGGGFEWFGQPPAHNVLTAYGLLEFSDMAEVYEVDPAVIDRTRAWLLEQQENDGSWEPTSGGIAEGAINAYQGETLRTTAYIAWAVAAAGTKDARLDRALDWMEERLGEQDDPYTLALAANALVASDRPAKQVLKRLEGLAEKKGDLVHWSSSSEGVTHSMGQTLDVETTALAAYALLASDYAVSTAHDALAWLVEQRDPRGTWRSTQATVHAMRALLRGTGPGAGSIDEPVHVQVSVNGEEVEQVEIRPDNADVFRTLDLGGAARTGDNRIELRVRGEGSLAYQVVATHYRPWPEERRERRQPLTIDVAYDTHELATDDELVARVTVAYNRPGVAKMTLVDLGIPPGFELLPEAFESLKQEGVIERYTVTGRQVILYFRELAQGEPVSFSYRLRAKYPLRVKTPPSSAYQYYEPSVRDEAEPVQLTVRGP